jgi:hypothetical protein
MRGRLSSRVRCFCLGSDQAGSQPGDNRLTGPPPPFTCLVDLPARLDFAGEFGAEVNSFVPFVYWLQQAGLLLHRRIRTYRGMRPFYFFLSPDQIEEHDEPRRFVFPQDRPPWLPNRDDHASHRSPFEMFPDYRAFFRDGMFDVDRPLLVIHNKVTPEWGHPPVNLLSIRLLDRLFTELVGDFHVVYLRPGLMGHPADYSTDHQPDLPFDDLTLLRSHPRVGLFDEMAAALAEVMPPNEVKLRLYAHTSFHVTVQGGNAHLLSMFSGGMVVILHRAGREIHHSYAHGHFAYAASPTPNWLICRNDDDVLRCIPVLREALLADGQVLLPSAHAETLRALSPIAQCQPDDGDTAPHVVPALTPAWLTSRAFAFKADGPKRLLAAALRFERNGLISGSRHPNETAWKIEDGKLYVLCRDGRPSCIAILTCEADGTATLAGPFLSERGLTSHLHRFEEVKRPADSLPEIRTFDLFDTLVARRCYEPLAIFRAVEQRSGVARFAHLRQTVEATLFGRGEYGFNDIYQALGEATDWPLEKLEMLKRLELAEEWENLFPIAATVARVGDNDVIVSDMYLPYCFLRRVIDEKCGLPGRQLFLSSHGKHSGKVWRKIMERHAIIRHHGDNHHTDVAGAQRAGIDAEHIGLTYWTRGEQILVKAGLADFATVLREARLRSFNQNPLLHRAQLAQFQTNIPLLIVASLIVLRRAREQGIDTILMCSRDCNLWVTLMGLLASRAAVPVMVRYFVASRVLFLADSTEYAAYFREMRGRHTMLVDVCGTGRTPTHFLGQIGAQADTLLFLICLSPEGEPANWVAELAPSRDDCRIEYVSRTDFPSRFMVEALNMSAEDRPLRTRRNGSDLEFERAPNEFGTEALELIAAMRAAFLGTTELLRQATIPHLAYDIPEETLRAAGQALVGLNVDFVDVIGIIAREISAREGEISSFAHAEQRRNHGERGSESAVFVPNATVYRPTQSD